MQIVYATMHVTLFLLLLLVVVHAHSSSWAVHLEPGTDARAWAAEHGLRYVESLEETLPNTHLVDGGSGRAARDVLGGELPPASVLWSEPQEARSRYRRAALIDDPLYADQWHLRGSPYAVDLPDTTPTGLGVLIGVVDDGLQHVHPEIADNYDARHSWNFNGRAQGAPVNDPSPGSSRDGHGTAAAAVAAGVAHNGHCGQGVAPRARMAGLRLIADPVTDVTEAAALSKFFSEIDGK